MNRVSIKQIRARVEALKELYPRLELAEWGRGSKVQLDRGNGSHVSPVLTVKEFDTWLAGFEANINLKPNLDALLMETEVYRLRKQDNPDPADFAVRWCQAAIAKAAGYAKRIDWGHITEPAWKQVQGELYPWTREQ